MNTGKLGTAFVGDRLRRAVREQHLVEYDADLADALIGVGDKVVCPAGSVLYEAGSPCLGVYFILHGRLELLRQGNQMSQMVAGDQVGTWPVLYSDPTYDVTARAMVDSVFLHVGEQEFRATADRFPALWERLARTQADRLKKMNELFLPTNRVPRLLVGSATKHLSIARSLKGLIRKEQSIDIDVELWTEVFPPGQSYLESLTFGLDDWDFAAFYMTPDDQVISQDRDDARPAPRDNIIFEAGLCMGRLGRKRTFLISPREPKDLKIPSDLAGIERLIYVKQADEVLDRLLELMKEYGSRTRIRMEQQS